MRMLGAHPRKTHYRAAASPCPLHESQEVSSLLLYLIVIFLCQLIGEALVTVLALPVPGPVIGMAILFVALLVRGTVPSDLDKVGGSFLTNMSLLFIPAGVGVMAQFELLGQEIVPLSVSLFLSTVLAIAVTGVLMNILSKDSPAEPADHAS